MSELAAHVTELSVRGPIRVSVAVCEEPLRDAPMIALCPDEMAPVLIVKLLVVAPGRIPTATGTFRTFGISPERKTAAPELVGFVKVTVQSVLALDRRDVAKHLTDEMPADPVSVSTVDWAEPFS